MGLFLSPFSGHAVGGGGHGVMDPPPAGLDQGGAGRRAEVDDVNRSPLRLLRTTMNKHKPKLMKIVPPGQQPGTVAPPYAWEPRERDDWAYETPKRKLGEAEFSTRILPAGGPYKSLETPKPHPTRRGDTRRLPKMQDPRHARVQAIGNELRQLRAEVHQLVQRLHQATQQGKQQVAATAKQFAPSHEGAPMESLRRSDLRLIEADDYTPYGIPRRSGDAPRPGWHIDPHESPLPMASDAERRQVAQMRELRQRGIPTGLRNQPPKASFEIIGLHNQISQKRARIKQLVDELKNLRMQMGQSRAESIGLGSNNLRRLGLLLQ